MVHLKDYKVNAWGCKMRLFDFLREHTSITLSVLEPSQTPTPLCYQGVIFGHNTRACSTYKIRGSRAKNVGLGQPLIRLFEIFWDHYYQLLPSNEFHFWRLNSISLKYTGCLKKNAPLCSTGHRGYQMWTIDKSRVSFEKFRKFPFWWAQKLLIFCQKMTEKNESKDAYPPWEKACFWIILKIFFFCTHFSDRIGLTF